MDWVFFFLKMHCATTLRAHLLFNLSKPKGIRINRKIKYLSVPLLRKNTQNIQGRM